ncbi:MAG: ABC transporter substrate-binding protein [Dehalococcoidia bacterium]|nr:ABC transporter substrate-binding protein [Dehalococcoidia bacterium]
MPPRRLLPLATLAIALFALFALACGDDEDEASPTATATASTATRTATGSPATGATAYPLTLKDMLGKDVTIAAAPQRIVATSPSAIEILYAAGGTSVARTSTARFPAEVASLPDIGRAEQLAFEQIIAQRPDLVLADASLQAQVATQLASALGGVPVVFVGATKYDDVATALRLVGRIVGKPAVAEAAAKAMDDAKATAKAAAAGKAAPKTLVIIGAPNDPYAALPESFVGDVLALAGGTNVAAGLPANAPFPGYTKLSLERIVTGVPDVVLTVTVGRPGGPTLADGIKGDAGYATLPAVRQNRVHNIDVEVFLQSPSPRAAAGLASLTKLLFPQ